jgi:hypothetical protein
LSPTAEYCRSPKIRAERRELVMIARHRRRYDGGSTTMNIPLGMDPAAEPMIQAELTRGERLLWAGRPDQGLLQSLNGKVALFLCGAAIAMSVAFGIAAAQLTGSPVLALLIIPVLPVAVCPFAAILFFVMRLRQRTTYALTDRRAVIVSDVFGRQVQSLPLANLRDVELSERPDGSGSIRLGPTRLREATPEFTMMDGARSVYELLTEAQRQLGSGAAWATNW